MVQVINTSGGAGNTSITKGVHGTWRIRNISLPLRHNKIRIKEKDHLSINFLAPTPTVNGLKCYVFRDHSSLKAESSQKCEWKNDMERNAVRRGIAYPQRDRELDLRRQAIAHANDDHPGGRSNVF